VPCVTTRCVPLLAFGLYRGSTRVFLPLVVVPASLFASCAFLSLEPEPECTLNRDCRDDELCSDGVCVQCERDCDAGDVCEDGECVDAAAGEGEGEGDPGEGEGEGDVGEGEGEGEGETGSEDDDAACSDGTSNDGDAFVDCEDFDCLLSPSVTVCGVAEPEVTDALCNDGESNDHDTFRDCDDFDCSKNIAVGVCGALTCGLDLGGATGLVRTGTLAGTDRSQGSCGGDGPDNVMLWTPPFSGTFQIDTAGSIVPTVLYTRSECGAQLDLACDASGLSFGTSTLTLSLTAGVPILIAIDTAAGQSGDYSLNINAI
jgi:hypothetical protein